MSTTVAGDQLLPGEIVAGKYRLVERCGSGGMGSVWRATHVGLDRPVAIKFLHGSVSRQSDARVRFEQEAKIGAKLGDESVHVVRVSDHGVTEGGRPFLVMELLEGESLSDRLEREGTLPLPLASTIAKQLCHALHVAHVAGVIHRDLKPANVFLARPRTAGVDGVLVKLLDFGVAKATLALDDPGVTRAGFIVGTPAYMSPEQITAERFIDARADLWSVVAIVYRMVVGAPPFGTGTIAELGKRITQDEPVAPSQLVADVPPAFDAWIARGLAKGRDARFQTTTDLADSLAELVHVVDHPAASEPRPSEPLAGEPPPIDWQPPRSSKPVLIGAALLCIGLAVAALYHLRTPTPVVTTGAAASDPGPGSIDSSAPVVVVVDASVSVSAVPVPPSIVATASAAPPKAKPGATWAPKKPGEIPAPTPIVPPMGHEAPAPTATASAPTPDEDF